ncbi:MAG: hypothetical protein ACE5HT_06190 [Gemmatimonadales bacterium]
MDQATTQSRVALRPLDSRSDYAQCAELQRQTWGRNFTEVVPPAMLMISQKVGGVSVGAFDSADNLVGFIYGISGVRDGRRAHWSHMLAVQPHMEGRGLGKRLKCYQRQLLLENGIEVAFWTYDPLVARNAHLNLNKLGAHVIRYVTDMYGEDTGSDLHSGLGTDRLIVQWELADPLVERILAGDRDDHGYSDGTPIVNADADGLPVQPDLTDNSAVRIEIPEDIQLLKSNAAERALAWRDTTRRAFLSYLDRGLSVTGFHRDPTTRRCFYALST